MTDWELLFTMIGEKATTDIAITRHARGFGENKHAAQRGGQIAYNTRKELEEETGKKVVSKNNFLNLTKRKKLNFTQMNKMNRLLEFYDFTESVFFPLSSFSICLQLGYPEHPKNCP